MEKKLYLFSYGTLRQKEIQEILLRSSVKMETAVLHGWRLYEDSDRYYFIKQESGHRVNGCLLELTEQQLWIIDQWEEVPSYTRKKVSVSSGDQEVTDVYIYYRPESLGRPVVSQGLSGHTKETDVATARAFRKTLDFSNRWSFIDQYITILCKKKEDLNLLEPDLFAKFFMKKLNEASPIHFERGFLGRTELKVNTQNQTAVTQSCPVFMTEDESSGRTAVTIAIPASILPTVSLIEAFVKQTLGDIEEWLEEKGLVSLRKAKMIIFSQGEVDEKEIEKSVIEEGNNQADKLNHITYNRDSVFVGNDLFIFKSPVFEENYFARIQSQAFFVTALEQKLFLG